MSARAFARRHRRWGPILVLAACFAHNLHASWLCWGDLAVDTGREIATAVRIANGEALYADLRSWYGPFAPYFNGLLFKLFGARYSVLCTAGAASAAVLCAVLYRLARQYMDRTAATLAAAAFLYLCAFAQLTFMSTFNFVLPYSFAATYGMCFAAASLLFLVRHAKKRRTADLALSLAALALAALCRVEALFPALLAHAAFLAFGCFERGRLSRAHAAGYAAAAAAVLGVYGLLAAQVGFSTLLFDNLLGAANPRMQPYILHVAGLDQPARSLGYAGASLLVFASLGATAWHFGRGDDARGRTFRAAGLAGVSLAGIGLLSPEVSLRAVPFLALALFVHAARAWRTAADAPARDRHLAAALLLAFTLGACARIPLRAVAYHYGFYLIPVGLVAVAWGFCAWLPHARRYGHPRTLARCAGWGALLGLIFSHAAVSRQAYATHTVEVAGAFGRMRLAAYGKDGPIGEPLRETLKLMERLPPDARVLAVPQGEGLIYFTGRANPYALTMYLPMDWSGTWNDEKIIAMWAANPPDAVLRLKYGSEFGTFGEDYAQAPWAWLRAHTAFYSGVRTKDEMLVEVYLRPGVTLSGAPQ
ncbi:MAG: glycosyltransferase family 39 protein [Planctomycetes bacterium]|nr:glycosyltransferase family 39 protein [Planctomycetota bacterium]